MNIDLYYNFLKQIFNTRNIWWAKLNLLENQKLGPIGPTMELVIICLFCLCVFTACLSLLTFSRVIVTQGQDLTTTDDSAERLLLEKFQKRLKLFSMTRVSMGENTKNNTRRGSLQSGQVKVAVQTVDLDKGYEQVAENRSGDG